MVTISDVEDGDWAAEIDEALAADLGDVPFALDTLADGREAVVIGDVARDRALWHQQGDNPVGFRSDCGLVASEGLLRQFGVEVTEADVVRHAIEHRQCHIADWPSNCGGTSAEGQSALLSDFGVPAHSERIGSLEELARDYEHGHGVIAEVNAGWLWDDPRHFSSGFANHAVLVTGVARSPKDGEVLGIFINDSGRGVPSDAGRFVDADTMQHSLIESGGQLVVTDGVRPYAAAQSGDAS